VQVGFKIAKFATKYPNLQGEKPKNSGYKGGTQIRTGEWKLCRLLPYHLAMPPQKGALYTKIDERVKPFLNHSAATSCCYDLISLGNP
jgi:hypothetical protein